MRISTAVLGLASRTWRVAAIPASAGFGDIATTAVEAPLWLGDDADDAVAFVRGTGMARGLLDSVDPATAQQAIDAVATALRPYERADGLTLRGAAWLVTARRVS